MKRFIIYIFLICATLCVRPALRAQVVEICAGNGTDSVTLSVGNYQYGMIQWQCSADGSTWYDLGEANDTIYRFLPEKDGYFRSMIFYNDCPYDSSQVSHVMVAPRADAGEDRLVNAGYMTQLRGNEKEGARSMWEVLEGDNAIIDDEEDPYTLFSGTDSLYRLQWTLANVCGVSHDTVEIRYVEPEFYDAIVVVDTTDQMFGDSLERYLGLYRIVFSDPAPVVTDSTILVGIPYGGFLRKVLYAEHRGDTVVMYTKQATLDDVIRQGAINFDEMATGQGSRNRGLYVRMDHLPTRAELQQTPRSRDGRIPYYEYPMEIQTGDGIYAAHGNDREFNFEFPFFTGEWLSATPSFKLKDFQCHPYPTSDFDYQKYGSQIHISYDQGFSIPFSFKLELEGSASLNADIAESTLDEEDLPTDILLAQLKKVGIFPIAGVPVTVSLTYKCKSKLKLSVSLTAKKTFLVSGEIKYGVGCRYDTGGEFVTHLEEPIQNLKLSEEVGSETNISGGIDLTFSIKNSLEMKLYEVLGPYFSISTPKMKLSWCNNLTDLMAPGQLSFKADIPIALGVKATVLKKTLFDFSYKHSWTIAKWTHPGKLVRYADPSSTYNYHNYHNGDVIPVKVQALSTLNLSDYMATPLGAVPFGVLYPGSDGNNAQWQALRGVSVKFSTQDGVIGSDGNTWFSSPHYAKTDANGVATVYWRPSNTQNNFHTIQASITDCSGKDINGSPVVIMANSCSSTNLTLAVVNGRLKASGGAPGYQYSIDGTVFFPEHTFNIVHHHLQEGHTYYVQDANGCIASVCCPYSECRITMNCSLEGRKAHVTVGRGTPPYSFYLDGGSTPIATNSNSTPRVAINNLSDGTHQITVVDDNECSATQTVFVAENKYAPIVFTNGAYNTQNNVYDEVQGIVVDDGNCAITERGIYWSTSASMASATKIMSSSNSDNFVCHIPNVSQGQILYACAYAVNEEGTGYGDTITLQRTDAPTPDQPTGNGNPCPGTPTVTDHEGNVYNTVQIGSQCWTKENMRCTTSPSTGTTILEASPSSSYSGKKAYYPNDNASNVATYGLLYNWNAAVDTFNTAYGETSTNTEYSNAPSVTFGGNRRGICPTGWHVPSDAEWTQLTDYVSSQSQYVCGSNSTYIAKALASTTGWDSDGGTCCVGNTPSTNNATVFSAVPAGSYFGSYVNGGGGAYFWSAAQGNSYYAYSRYLFCSNAFVDSYYSPKKYGYSVRCLRDENTTSEVLPNSCPGTPTVTDMDGNTYNTVQIGQQCWMKENLKTTKYADGTSIPQGTTTSYADPYWYYPNDNSANKATYGLLYNWKAVMRNASSSSSPSGVQGICPTGWHVPSNAEWTQLTDYVSSQSEYCCNGNSRFSYIAKALASTSGWEISSRTCEVGNDQSSNNATGFKAVPAGTYDDHGYGNLGIFTYFWSATEAYSNSACYRTLHYDLAYVYYDYTNKNYGFSVRCLRD